ncbi:unnamed protein product [Prunus armeniaca]
MALSSRWKLLNKEMAKWRDALAKAMNLYRSGENRTNELIQAQMWFGATGGGKKRFTHHECWEVVKYCKRFIIIPTGPDIVLNETPLRDSTTSDSPLDSPMSEDSPIQKEPRPIGRKAAKAKKAETPRYGGGNSSRTITRKGVFAQKRSAEDGSGNHGNGYKSYVPRNKTILEARTEGCYEKKTFPR